MADYEIKPLPASDEQARLAIALEPVQTLAYEWGSLRISQGAYQDGVIGQAHVTQMNPSEIAVRIGPNVPFRLDVNVFSVDEFLDTQQDSSTIPVHHILPSFTNARVSSGGLAINAAFAMPSGNHNEAMSQLQAAMSTEEYNDYVQQFEEYETFFSDEELIVWQKALLLRHALGDLTCFMTKAAGPAVLNMQKFERIEHLSARAKKFSRLGAGVLAVLAVLGTPEVDAFAVAAAGGIYSAFYQRSLAEDSAVLGLHGSYRGRTQAEKFGVYAKEQIVQSLSTDAFANGIEALLHEDQM